MLVGLLVELLWQSGNVRVTQMLGFGWFEVWLGMS